MTLNKQNSESKQRRRPRTVIGCVALILAAGVSGARAQEAPSLATIRTSQFSGVDRNNVQRWLEAQMNALFASDQPLQDGRKLVFDETNGLVTHYRASNATDAFRTGLAQLVAESFVAAYGQGKPGGTPAATYPLMALKIFGQPSAVDAYQAALGDESAAIRTLAVQGLVRIRDTLNWDGIVQLIQRAAIPERNDVALGEMYRLLMINDAQKASQSLAAILAILDARLERFSNTSTLPSTADARAIAWVAGRWNAINANDVRTRIVERTARLLAHAVHDYLIMVPETQQLLKDGGSVQEVNATFSALTGLPAAELGLAEGDTPEQVEDKIEQTFSRLDTLYGSSTPRRIDLERTIHDVEKALTTMVNPNSAPSIRTPMLTAKGSEKVAGVLAELNKWIGDRATDGVLNAAPYNLPKHLGVTRTLPATPTP